MVDEPYALKLDIEVLQISGRSIAILAGTHQVMLIQPIVWILTFQRDAGYEMGREVRRGGRGICQIFLKIFKKCSIGNF